MYINKVFMLILVFILNLNASSKENITLHLDWLHQFQFAGYYMAKEKGYYNNYDLNVEIKELSQNSNINEEMKKPSNYGIGRTPLVLEQLKGEKLILLSAIFQSSPLVLISLEDSNIKTPKDLKNKKIMINNEMLSLTIESIIKSQEIKKEDILVQEHSFNLNDLINKKTDAMACYLSNEPFLLNKKGIKFNIMNPADYGFDFYEGILFTSEDELIKYPKRVENFNYASLKGWEYAFNNIEETAKLIYEKYNTQNKSLEALIYEGKVLKELSKIEEGYLGEIEPKKINEIKRFYNLLGLNPNNNDNFDVDSIILKKSKLLLNEKEYIYLKRNDFSLYVENDKVPFSFTLSNKLKGLEIDFWNLISSKIDIPFNIKINSSEQPVDTSNNLILTRFVYSYGNKPTNGYLLTNSIVQIPTVLATTNDKNIITDLSILKNVKVGVVNNYELIKILENENPSIKFININSTNDGIIKLKSNDIYAFVDNIYEITNKINTQEETNIKINSPLKYKLNVFLEVPVKDKIFVDILNEIIFKLTIAEKIEILKKYDVILYKKEIDILYVLKIVIPLLILLSIFMYLYFKLKVEIEKRKNIEKKLNIEILQNKNLLNDNKRFIADTVHQIKTPLTNIMMNSEMIKLYEKDNVSQYIEQIDASINMLTNSYEDLSYITSYDIFEYKATNLNISNILKQRIKFFTTISKVNYKKLDLTIEKDFFVTINNIEFERIVDNNISNGIKYADLNKPITINLFSEDNNIVMEFKSFGKQIKNTKAIFMKSYKENESKRGLGLGLNMVKRICDKYKISYDVKYIDDQNIFIYKFEKSFK